MPLTLIPGFMLDRDLWSDIAGDLAPFGPLTFADTTAAASIEEMARQALEASAPRFSLIGFSMGGYVARAMQRLAPERVERLVLIATSTRPDGQTQASRRAAPADTARYSGMSRVAIRRSLAPEREADAELVERIREMSLRLGGAVFARQAALHRTSDLALLGGITCPALVLAGRQDRLRALEEAEEMAAAIPGARLEVLDTGHMIPMEAPERCARLLCNFLAAD